MRVLMIEDDQMLGPSMVTSLNRNGYTVDWLQKGNGTLSALKTDQFACVILDLMLPDIDGLDLLGKIRKAGFDLPVLILTARDELSDRVRGLDGGADDYLVKPFALEELLARLRVLIRRRGGYSESILEHGPIRLSLAEQKVTVAGETVTLTRHEFKLLSSLMTQPGRVLSKEQLHQAMYGWDEGGSDNSLEVHIHNLRKKLPASFIRTIRGVGYVFAKDSA
ncbi:response regulator [Celerinatantimonas sp. MCCC 1A17872]|uniref:response regulator n=1 Tax=Celerinatantimonas sp. MCCC 1A17872 TaxID=3177514 RepID=UPI0038CB8A6B